LTHKKKGGLSERVARPEQRVRPTKPKGAVGEEKKESPDPPRPGSKKRRAWTNAVLNSKYPPGRLPISDVEGERRRKGTEKGGGSKKT